MEDKELYYRLSCSKKEFNFTSRGSSVLITLKNGKQARASVEKCIGGYADVKLNGKTVLINSNFKVI